MKTIFDYLKDCNVPSVLLWNHNQRQLVGVIYDPVYSINLAHDNSDNNLAQKEE